MTLLSCREIALIKPQHCSEALLHGLTNEWPGNWSCAIVLKRMANCVWNQHRKIWRRFGLEMSKGLQTWNNSESRPVQKWRQAFFCWKSINADNSYLYANWRMTVTQRYILNHIISRPGRSQGLLYKPCDWLIKWVSQSAFSSQSFTAPPRPNGWS